MRARALVEKAVARQGKADSVFSDWAPWTFCQMLNGLEETYGDRSAFQGWVRRFQEANRPRKHWPAQWYLRPVARPATGHSLLFEDPLRTAMRGWSWQDPLGDSDRLVGDGLQIQASCGRDLVPPNLSAPRMVRTLPTALHDTAVEVTCAPGQSDRPAIGGLVLWQDATHFLRLEVGRYGKWDIGFGGCLGDRARVIIGRGRLPEAPLRDWSVDEPVTLRLEIAGDRVTALCSLDGEQWYAVGDVVFPIDGAVQVGVHAVGLIHFKRTIYHGAYPDGTAIRFTDFRMWDVNEGAAP